MKSVWLVVCFTMMLLIIPPGISAQDDGPPGVDCPKKVRVLVEEIAATETFTEYNKYSVTFAPEVAVARTTMAGTVTDVKVSDGDLVSQGFVLVMLNEGLEADAKDAAADLARWKKILWNREHWKVRSPAAETQAKTRVEEAQALLEEIQSRAPEASVAAPLAGTVELLVAPGTEVEAGAEVARVTNRRRKVARLDVDADDISLFTQGREIDLGDGMTAVVAGVEDGTVVLHVDDPADALGEGPKHFKLLKRKVADALVIPADRVLRDEEGPYVFVVNGKTARRAALTVDGEYEGRALIADGLAVGDLMITAQILSPKKGEVASSLQCLEDGKRIRPMVKDPESGRYVKFKGEVPAVAEPEPEEVTEEARPEPQPEPEVVQAEEPREIKEEKTWRPSLGIGVGFGVSMMSDEVFKEVYGSSATSFDFRLVYAFMPQVEAFLAADYSTKTGTILGVDAETKIVRAPIALGVRYVFQTGKFKPYLGLAAVAFNVKETNDYAPNADYITRWGFGLVGGVYYSVASQVDLFLGMRYGFGTHKIDNFDDEAKLDTLRLHLGVVYRFRL